MLLILQIKACVLFVDKLIKVLSIYILYMYDIEYSTKIRLSVFSVIFNHISRLESKYNCLEFLYKKW